MTKISGEELDFVVPGRNFARTITTFNLIICIISFIGLIFLVLYDIWFNNPKFSVLNWWSNLLLQKVFTKQKGTDKLMGLTFTTLLYIGSAVVAFLWLVVFPFLFHRSYVTATFDVKKHILLKTVSLLFVFGLIFVFIAALFFKTSIGTNTQNLLFSAEEKDGASIIQEAKDTEAAILHPEKYTIQMNAQKNKKHGAHVEVKDIDKNPLISAKEKKMGADNYPTTTHRGLVSTATTFDKAQANINKDYDQTKNTMAALDSLKENDDYEEDVKDGKYNFLKKRNDNKHRKTSTSSSHQQTNDGYYDDTFIYLGENGEIKQNPNTIHSHKNTHVPNDIGVHEKTSVQEEMFGGHKLGGLAFSKKTNVVDPETIVSKVDDSNLTKEIPEGTRPYDRVLKLHEEYKNGHISYDEFTKLKKTILQ